MFELCENQASEFVGQPASEHTCESLDRHDLIVEEFWKCIVKFELTFVQLNTHSTLEFFSVNLLTVCQLLYISNIHKNSCALLLLSNRCCFLLPVMSMSVMVRSRPMS